MPDRQPEHVVKNASQKEAFTAAVAMMPMIDGKLVEYTEDGLPDVEEENKEQEWQEVLDDQEAPAPVMPQRKAKPIEKRNTDQMQVKVKTNKQEAVVHPILNRMLNKFGLKRIKRYELELTSNDGGDKFRYTMTLVPEDCSLWAVREAKEKMGQEGTDIGSGWLSMLIVSLSVVAIDGTPIYEIFGVKPETKEEQNDLATDRLNLSARMRRLTGMALAKVFWSDVTPLADKLYEFYEGRIIPSSKVVSSYELEASGSERYVCVYDNCNVTEFLKPQYDETGGEMPYYCKVHKTELVRTANLGVDENPLV